MMVVTCVQNPKWLLQVSVFQVLSSQLWNLSQILLEYVKQSVLKCKLWINTSNLETTRHLH